ncbi:MAG: DUF4838 domain-containing protein [Lentisphaerae bacterium]|nr:DUF4838 domain-containing protein [Lentisphaerota bacterium]
MSLLLARASRARSDIAIPPAAGRVLRFAAAELARYLKAISGAEFTIAEAPASGNAITLAARAAAGGDDAFELVVTDSAIAISASNERSALYGVYELLETLGCVFAEPGIETVPRLPDLEIRAFRKSYAAAFPLRNIFRIQKINVGKNGAYHGFEEHHRPQIDWMAKRKLNRYLFYVDHNRYDLWERYKHQVLDDLLNRGFDLELTQHSMGYFCPADAEEDYAGYGPATYQATHPDWYSGPRKVRIEIPEVQAIVFSRFMDFVRRNPELDTLALWPIDSGMKAPYEGMNPADGYLIFWNKLAERLAAEFPGKKLSVLAYFDLLEPPLKTRGHPNLHLWFCPVFAHSMYPMTDRRNRRYLDQFSAWSSMMPPRSIGVFGYYGWYPLLTPLAHKMKQDLKAYGERGAAGIYGWCGFSYNLMGTGWRWARELNILADLHWNPDCDPEQVARRWARAVFGEAADDILRFYQIIREFYDEEAPRGLGGGREQQVWISLPTLRRGLAALDAARGRAAGDAVLRRIDLLEETLAHGAAAVVPRTDPRDNLEGIYPF